MGGGILEIKSLLKIKNYPSLVPYTPCPKVNFSSSPRGVHFFYISYKNS